MVSGFNSVFEAKLDRIKAKLKSLLANSGKKANRQRIKILLQEAKSLRTILKNAEHTYECPKCGHKY